MTALHPVMQRRSWAASDALGFSGAAQKMRQRKLLGA